MQRVFGSYVLCTAVPLKSLPTANFEDDDVSVIDIAWTTSPTADIDKWCHHWRDSDEVVLSLARQGSTYWLRVPDLGSYLLQLDPPRILISPDAASLDPATLEHQLVDQILPRLLAQLGELLVHASALTINGRNALFLGPSGWGKSTLAGLLQRRGHTVLSDDCVQVNPEGERFNAIPTYPSLRLFPDSLDAVFPDLVETTPVANYTEKRRVPMPPPTDVVGGVPIEVLYLLGDPAKADGSIRISPLRPAEICLSLIRHSFRLDLSDRVATVRHLDRCSAIARAVPAFRIDYPRDFALHDEIEQAITRHLTGLPAPT